MWLLHLKNLKKLKLTWQKWNSSFKYEPNMTQREWGSIIVTRVVLWQSEVRTSFTRRKLLCQAAWREIWRGMKMAFLPFFSIKPASLPVSELARLGDYATAWKKQPLRITVSLCEKYMTAYALALATALPLQHTLGMFPTPHCGKWALLRGSLAFTAAQALRQDPRQHFAPEL